MKHTIKVKVNGMEYEREIEARRFLIDFIRDDLGLTGTHLGCDLGQCGACTVIINGITVRSCLMFAVQADGAEILTVEGLAQDGKLHPLQEAFWANHALQCGYCTPGMLLAAYDLLGKNPDPTEDDIRAGISGNLCRCTGYVNIVKAIRAATVKISNRSVR